MANQANRVAALSSPTDEDILTITTADLEGLVDLPIQPASAEKTETEE